MNGLDIVQHAYASIAKNHSDKDAFQITADVESLADRLAAAALRIDEALSGPVVAASQQG